MHASLPAFLPACLDASSASDPGCAEGEEHTQAHPWPFRALRHISIHSSAVAVMGGAVAGTKRERER